IHLGRQVGCGDRLFGGEHEVKRIRRACCQSGAAFATTDNPACPLGSHLSTIKRECLILIGSRATRKALTFAGFARQCRCCPSNESAVSTWTAVEANANAFA